MDRNETEAPPESEPVPSTERCAYVPEAPLGKWRVEHLPAGQVVIAEPVDSAQDGLVVRSRR